MMHRMAGQEWKKIKRKTKKKMRDDQHLQGATWSRAAKYRQKWRNLAERYFQQWRDTLHRYKVQILTKWHRINKCTVFMYMTLKLLDYSASSVDKRKMETFNTVVKNILSPLLLLASTLKI